MAGIDWTQMTFGIEWWQEIIQGRSMPLIISIISLIYYYSPGKAMKYRYKMFFSNKFPAWHVLKVDNIM